MKLCFLTLLMFTGFVPVLPSGPRKYYLLQQTVTWSTARAYCQNNHIDLAIIESAADLDKLQNDEIIQQLSLWSWIGIYNDFDSWCWSFDNTPLGVFRPWFLGEPNNQNGDEQCVAVRTAVWYDLTCTDSAYFMCYDASLTVKFVYYNVYKSWSDAQSYCRLHHTDLASAKDEMEYAALLLKIPLLPVEYVWIGLFRESWRWVDQTKVSNLVWKPGQPDNYFSNEMCGYLKDNMAGDASCSDLNAFICYRIITGQRRILKVKARSDQDINTVQAAILEKIMQKLQEHGVGYITVKFLKQPDGAVFHKVNSTN